MPFVGVFPEQTVIVTKMCSGYNFNNLINSLTIKQIFSRHRNFLKQISFNCGSWLSRFHNLTDYSKINHNEWLRYQRGEVEWRINLLVKIDRNNELMYRRCGKKLKNEFMKSNLSQPSSLTHGDFAPHNIFVSSDRKIQVLDFFGIRIAHPLSDVVNYLGKVASFSESLCFQRKKGLLSMQRRSYRD